ncbi:MAG: ABC transporter permease, partial [bacterium]|nr:ABC transporter permease [bacterium]
ILTMLGIIIGVASVILLVSIGHGLQKYITEQFEQLGANLVVVVPGRVARGGGNALSSGPPNFNGSKLTLADADRVAKIQGPIESVGTGIESPGSVSYQGKTKYTTVAGMDETYMKIRNLDVSRGKSITVSDVRAGRNVVILGTSVIEKLFGQGQALGREVTIGGQKFKVIGVLKSIGSGGLGVDVNDFAIIPVTSAQKVFGMKTIMVIGVKAETKEDIPQVISIVKKELLKKYKDEDFSVLDQSSLVESINQILGMVTIALGGIAAISLVVGGVGIMNIMLVSVTERTREIGLRKAVGAKPNDILYQFIIEAVTLSLTGGIIGVLVGALGSFALSRFVSTSVSFWSVVLAFGVSAVVGIIFGVAPAARASKLDPIEALKYE